MKYKVSSKTQSRSLGNKPKYNPPEIEKKWQKYWEENKTYQPDLDSSGKPFYNLMMFPYPSAEGMHVGNMYAFTGADVYGRFKRMQGNDVFEPIGLDGFGIHSENYALKVGRHPKEQAKISEENFYRQLHAIGNGFDWSAKLETYDPQYYKWTQWIFIQLFKKGLAYRKKASVNFCPQDKTVLADEQVIAGYCERCGTEIVKKDLEQWFFKITDYAERLLNNIDNLDWSEKVKIAQRNWIGKSEGLIIDFGGIDVFTTRPETADGATFLILSPDHPKAKIFNSREVKDYIKTSQKKTDEERRKEKTGVFTGEYIVNPVTKKKIPIWIADYVLMEYGTGAIMAVPGQDQRDKEFAKKYKLSIEKTTLKANPKGRKVINYHLRDWLISRQRYWGPPIPMIYCEKCDWQPVAEKDLPVLLPDVKDWKPTGTEKSPLASVESFVKTKCPSCGEDSRRETDVSDTFLDSAWYFFRYTSTEEKNSAWVKSRAEKWLPVNMYIGGAEHSVLHLLYSRFITMVFKDLKLISFEEPYSKFRAHGLLIKEGAKMSKSRGNVVIPDKYIKKFGADTLRIYLMFLGPFTQGGDFYDTGIEGMHRFVKRIWTLSSKVKLELKSESSKESLKLMHKTIKKVTEDIENLRYNTAIASLMEYYNFISREKRVSKEEILIIVLLLSPFAPHVTEELWAKLGEKSSVHVTQWPSFDPKFLIEDEVTIVVQINGKIRDTLRASREESENQQLIEKIAKESQKINNHLNNRKIKKVVFVKGRVINFVVA